MAPAVSEGFVIGKHAGGSRPGRRSRERGSVPRNPRGRRSAAPGSYVQCSGSEQPGAGQPAAAERAAPQASATTTSTGATIDMAALRNFLVRGALAVALLLPIYFLLAALATRFGLVDWRVGFVTLTLGGGLIMVLVTVVAALVGLVLALTVKPRQGWQRALIALAIPVVGVGAVLGMTLGRSGATALIHDIVTDPAAPLVLSPRVMADRARVPGVNPVEVDPRLGRDGSGGSVREVQRTVYPDIRPILLGKPAPAAFEQALATARSLGWSVEYSDAASGRIEATVQSFWYGFIDDIAVQVAPAAAGARIDLRSISRVGEGDIGANAARIRAFREALSAG